MCLGLLGMLLANLVGFPGQPIRAQWRANRSLTLVFSALIWSNIVDDVLSMVAFSGFRSIEMINLAGV